MSSSLLLPFLSPLFSSCPKTNYGSTLGVLYPNTPASLSRFQCFCYFKGPPQISPTDDYSYSLQNVVSGTQALASASSGSPPVKAAKRVVLVRHGQSTWNEEGRIQGSSNFSVLTVKGETKRRPLARCFSLIPLTSAFTEYCNPKISSLRLVTIGLRVEHFRTEPIWKAQCFLPVQRPDDVLLFNPLTRSKRTAEIIWGGRKEQMISEWDLREIDLHSFQGLLKHEGKSKYGDSYRQWQIDAPNFNIDGHYPVRELWARARSCWDKILQHDGQSILVVAHNAVNQALVAAALGLGTEYFRILLQSNCGVSVLDFTLSAEGEPLHVSLNRLNQTPNSPVAAGSSGGRKSRDRIVLVCHGGTQVNNEGCFSSDAPLNMLGIIQSQKTAELLLDLKVNSVISSPQEAASVTAATISKVQEAADCLGVDCVPRDVEIMLMQELMHPCNQTKKRKGIPGASSLGLWETSGEAWRSLLEKVTMASEPENNLVVVAHPMVHSALIAHCLKLGKEKTGSFYLDEGSVSVIDFPDGLAGRGVIRCINYTAHLSRWSIPVTRPSIEEELQF